MLTESDASNITLKHFFTAIPEQHRLHQLSIAPLAVLTE